MNDSKNRYPKDNGGDGYTPPTEIIPDLLEPIDEEKMIEKARLHDIPLPERIQSRNDGVVIDASDRFGQKDPEPDK